MKAFIIVDLQNDFCPGGALAVHQGDVIVPLINQIQTRFKTIVATQDWHPADHLSFASQHHKKPGEVIMLNGQSQVLWPDHCVQDTPGAAFVSALETSRISEVIRKGADKEIDSYSGFFDNNHRKATGLEAYLKKKKLKKIYIAGLATDYCVKFTTLDALHLGFDVAVIEDACRGVELAQGDTQQALKQMCLAGATIITSRELL